MGVPDLTKRWGASLKEDTPGTFMMRLKVESGGNLVNAQQSDFSSISYKVFDGPTEIAAGSLTPIANYVFNTLQTGSIWTADSEGYNFKVKLPASHFPEGNKVYLLEFKYTLANGDSWFEQWDVAIQAVQTS